MSLGMTALPKEMWHGGQPEEPKMTTQELKDFLTWARDNGIAEIDTGTIKAKFYRAMPPLPVSVPAPKLDDFLSPDVLAEKKKRQFEKDLFGV